LLVCVLPIPPGESRVELSKTHILPANVDGTNVTTVAINLVAIGFSVFPKSELGQVLLRALTVGLSFLWSVDAGETDLALLPVAVEQRERIAVCNGHDSALENLSPDGGAGESEKNQEQRAHGVALAGGVY
jgi:hypothetical protein